MHVDSLARTPATLPGPSHPAPHLQLTTSEFLQLGLYRVAYVTRVIDEDGTVNFIVHGADGMTVAAVESAALAWELAGQLGLGLVAVH